METIQNQSYPNSTYHRRAVYAMARLNQGAIHGRTLHVGGTRSFWLLRTAESVISLELVPGQDVDVVGNTLALPFQDETFDTVVAIEVIEHVPYPQTMVDEIYRVLRPGGQVVLSTPFVWKVHRTPKDYWRFTRDSLELLFARFHTTRVCPVNGERETLMHVLYQYAEVLLDSLRLPRRLIYCLKPVEWVTYAVIPKSAKTDPMWTTGWFVLATK